MRRSKYGGGFCCYRTPVRLEKESDNFCGSRSRTRKSKKSREGQKSHCTDDRGEDREGE